MPFYPGTANNMGALVTALKTACTANGWTAAGNVIHKGGCYVHLDVILGSDVQGDPAPGQREYLRCRIGNGIDGSNNLTDMPASAVHMGPLIQDNPAPGGNSLYIEWAWPVNYDIHVHASPDEVFLVIDYNSDTTQWLGFGQSPGPGCPGTGNWHHALLGAGPAVAFDRYRSSLKMGAGPKGIDCGGFSSTNMVVPQPFWMLALDYNAPETYDDNLMNYHFHGMRGDTGAAAWSRRGYVASQAVKDGCSAAIAIQPLLERQPNAPSGNATLLSLAITVPRPSQKVSIVGQIAHMRTLRMDYLNAGTIIDLTPDKWKVYPCYRKNTTAPAGGQGINNHSGCYAIAIRYDGP